jgi:hypothetical protein
VARFALHPSKRPTTDGVARRLKTPSHRSGPFSRESLPYFRSIRWIRSAGYSACGAGPRGVLVRGCSETNGEDTPPKHLIIAPRAFTDPVTSQHPQAPVFPSPKPQHPRRRIMPHVTRSPPASALCVPSTTRQHVIASRVLTDLRPRAILLSLFVTCEQCKTVVRCTGNRTGVCRCPVRFFYAPPACVATLFQNPMSGGYVLGTRYRKVV